MYYYSLSSYGSMITDGVRWPAYQRALEIAVKPGSIVADIGCGPGVAAFLACQLGAGQVYAVEPNDVIQIAREAAAASGLTDRLIFLQDLTTAIDPAPACDVLVSDLRGVLPFHEHHIPAIVDARTRWLKPGGIQIPQQDTLQIALLENESVYSDYDGPWRKLLAGVDFEAARRKTINTYGKCRAQAEHLLSQPQTWLTLDYRSVTDPNASAKVVLKAEREGVAHGFIQWFDTELIEGLGFSSGPGTKAVYGQMFYPFQEPIPLRAGDEVQIDLRARLIAGDYQWIWNTDFQPGDEERPAISYRQSSLQGLVFSPQSLARRAHTHVPKLNEDGQVERAVLEHMASGMTLGEIATSLAKAFPKKFPSADQALAFVGELSVRFSA